MARLTTTVCVILVTFATGALADSNGEESQLVRQIRSDLKSMPQQTVDRLNDSLMQELLQQDQYRAVEEFAVTGTLAVPADTWRIEQLQKHRITALLKQNKPQEALRAAKALFNVCGMGFVKEALPLLCQCVAAVHPEDPGIVPRFKLQILAGAQEDPGERSRLLKKYGGNSVMESMEADPAPYAAAIAQRRGLNDYRSLYGTGNLLLLSGRINEAKEVFQKVYDIAPAGELKYASEAIAKLIKAEDGGLGRANQFVLSIRPKQ